MYALRHMCTPDIDIEFVNLIAVFSNLIAQIEPFYTTLIIKMQLILLFWVFFICNLLKSGF